MRQTGMRDTSGTPKRTAAFHLPAWLLDAIEALARARGTNKSHELARVAALGLARDPDAQALRESRETEGVA